MVADVWRSRRSGASDGGDNAVAASRRYCAAGYGVLRDYLVARHFTTAWWQGGGLGFVVLLEWALKDGSKEAGGDCCFCREIVLARGGCWRR